MKPTGKKWIHKEPFVDIVEVEGEDEQLYYVFVYRNAIRIGMNALRSLEAAKKHKFNLDEIVSVCVGVMELNKEQL